MIVFTISAFFAVILGALFLVFFALAGLCDALDCMQTGMRTRSDRLLAIGFILLSPIPLVAIGIVIKLYRSKTRAHPVTLSALWLIAVLPAVAAIVTIVEDPYQLVAMLPVFAFAGCLSLCLYLYQFETY